MPPEGTVGDAVDHAIAEMDDSGTDIAFVVPERFLFVSDDAFPLQSNTFVIEACARYPDRLFPAPNFHPSRRGVKAAIWEMEYFAKEKGCRFFKFYPPDEVWPMNDERLWPFYAKAQELGLVVGAHTGGGGVYGTSSTNGHPIQFDDICKEFYDLKILAFPYGYPWVNEMCLMAGVYPNLCIGMSWLNRTITSRASSPSFSARLSCTPAWTGLSGARTDSIATSRGTTMLSGPSRCPRICKRVMATKLSPRRTRRRSLASILPN